jgi:hypothetical protein
MADAKTETRTVVKAVKNAKLYSDGTILLMAVRCSHPHVFKAQENKADDGTLTYSYSVIGLMDKTTHEEAKALVLGEINRVLKEDNKGEKIAADKKFLRNGDPRDEDDAGKPENLGMWVVATREQKRPIVLSNRKDPETGKARRLNAATPDDVEMIYGGCYVHMLIRPWWQNNKFGKRVNAGISVLQFYKKGEPFGSGRITEDDVDDTFDTDDDAADIDGDEL